MNGAYTVAVHYSSGDLAHWQQAINNVSNLFRDESVPTGDGDLSLVVNGYAIRFLTESAVDAERVRRMAGAGVRVVACGNSMERFDVSEEDLVDGVEIVNSGVAELVRLQAGGAAYVKVP
jgi:intracellular sulfur oxidation DsrE/DsrF family protein